MLRMSYMHSDFHPILLILGNRSGLAHLAGMLESFAGAQEEWSIESSSDIHLSETQLTLMPSGDDSIGLVRSSDNSSCSGDAELLWYMGSSESRVFATKVRDLAEGREEAGSTLLEIPTLDEIKVRVSMGEFESDFLEPEQLKR